MDYMDDGQLRIVCRIVDNKYELKLSNEKFKSFKTREDVMDYFEEEIKDQSLYPIYLNHLYSLVHRTFTQIVLNKEKEGKENGEMTLIIAKTKEKIYEIM